MSTNINLSGINELDVTLTGGTSSASVSNGIASLTLTPASGITLKTNGVNNGSQSILNLKNGSNVTITDDGVGGITIAASGGGPTTYAPQTITNLLYWFSAYLLNLQNNQSVSRWLDYNVSSNQLTSNVGNGPTFLTSRINGKPSINENNNSSNDLIFSNLYTPHTTTIFVVFKPLVIGTVQTLVAGQTNALQLRLNAAGKLELVQCNTAVIATDTTVLSAGTWYQVNVTYNDSTGAFAFRVARAASSSGTNIKAISNPWTTHNYNPSTGATNVELANYELAELLIYARVLSGAEISTIETFYNGWYGI